MEHTLKSLALGGEHDWIQTKTQQFFVILQKLFGRQYKQKGKYTLTNFPIFSESALTFLGDNRIYSCDKYRWTNNFKLSFEFWYFAFQHTSSFQIQGLKKSQSCPLKCFPLSNILMSHADLVSIFYFIT